METLQEFKQRAIWAHNWTSFDPDARGERLVNEFTDILNNDLEEIKAANDEQKKRYVGKFKSLFSSWISAKSNCASSVITGGSGFNVRRAEKANNRERAHYEAFEYWRAKAKKTIIKSLQPEKTFYTELERLKNDLEGMKINHELMKEGNKRIKQAARTGEDLTEYLTNTFGILPHMIDWTLKFGFGLANNNANIKRVEERIKDLENKAAKQAEGKNKEFYFDGGKVILNYEIDRLQILHDTKPSSETIGKLKHAGFKWAPSQAAWQRQLTNNAIYSLKYFSGIQINGGL